MKNTAQFFRDSHDAMCRAVLEEIRNVLLKEPDNILELDDDSDSLVVQDIDFQSSQRIMSTFLKYETNKPPRVMVKVGIYEPDFDITLENYNYEKMIDVLAAVDRAKM
jgi:hypothetical protein